MREFMTTPFDNPVGYGIDPETTQDEMLEYIYKLKRKIIDRDKEIKCLKEIVKDLENRRY